MITLTEQEILISLILSEEFLSMMALNEVVILGGHKESRDEALVDMVDRLYFIQVEFSLAFYSALDKGKSDSEQKRRNFLGVFSEELLR